MTIPNYITFARFLAVPVVIYALAHGHMLLAFLLFVAAGLSDAVDGIIARRYDLRSRLGAWLDPLADKLLLVSVFVMLFHIGELPGWLVILVVSRDILIVAGVALAALLGKPIKAAPLLVSKANTVAQIGLVLVVLLSLAFAIALPGVVFALILAAAGLTIVSAASYFVVWMRHIEGAGNPR